MSYADREESIEDFLVRRCKEEGWEHRKVAWVGRSRAPDRLIGRSGWPGSYHVLVELKKPGLAAKFPDNYKPHSKKWAHEQAQAREHERLRAIGFDVRVIDSKEAIEAVLAT